MLQEVVEMLALGTRPRRFNDSPWLSGVLFLLAAITYVPASATQSNPSPSPITEGQILSQTHGAGELISYAFEARLGQTYLIEVTQDRLDLIVAVDSPGGDSQSFSSPLRRDESEFVLLEDWAGRIYRITPHSEESTDVTGSHTIQVSALDDTMPQLKAWRLVSEGAVSDWGSECVQ